MSSLFRRRQLEVILTPHDGLTVALDYLGRPLVFPLGAGHLLLGGVTGSGKSTVLRSLVRYAACKADVALVGVDLKLVELCPWAPRFEALAHEPAETVDLLGSVVDELRARRQVLGDAGATEWNAALGPWLVVVVDELAEVVEGPGGRDALAALVSIGHMGRALGVVLVCATQRPDADVLTGQLRGQFDWRVGLRMRDPSESRLLCSPAVADLTQLDSHEGWWLPPLPHRPTRCKAEFVPPEARLAIALRTMHLAPRLERFTQGATL